MAAIHRKKFGIAALAVAVELTAVAPAPEASACGYHDPQLVSRGFLNWIYPDSLYVVGAISREVATRRLPLPNFDQAGTDLFGRRYRATTTALRQFGEMLGESSRSWQAPVSLVLVEPMLWTRFERAADGVRTRIHVSGAERDDVVLVSGEAVIGEIAARRLTLVDAVERGLVRVYGTGPQIGEFLARFRQVGAADDLAKRPLPDASLLTTSAVGSSFTERQSSVAGTMPTELGCTPNHPTISMHKGERP